MDYALARDLTGVFIPEVTVGDGFWTACRALERKCYVGVEMIEAPRLIKRSWFVENGGFVADVAGQEDAELRMRMLDQGVPMGHIDTYILHDEGRMTFADIMRKRYYYGKSLPAYNRAQPGAISKQGAATLQAMVKGLPILAGDPVHGAALVGSDRHSAPACCWPSISGGHPILASPRSSRGPGWSHPARCPVTPRASRSACSSAPPPRRN